MKLALCFYGQPRFIDNEHCFSSIRDNILSKYDVGVFAHCWFDSSKEKFTSSDWSNHHDNYIHKNAPQLIQEKYSPKCFLIENPKQFIENEDIKQKCSNLNFFSNNNFYNLQSHLYSFEQSLNLLKNHVRLSGERFDYVISTRYDILVRSFPNADTLEKDRIYVDDKYQFSDGIYLFDYDLIEEFTPYTNFKEITKFVQIFTSEEYKKYKFLKNHNQNKVCKNGIYTSLARSRIDNTGQV